MAEAKDKIPEEKQRLVTNFEEYYRFVVQASNISGNFDEEIINLNGITFRDLMEEGALLVIKNIDTLKAACQLKWNFHSAFFFAGTGTVSTSQLSVFNLHYFTIY